MAKMTKKEMFVEIRNAVADNEEMVAFIDHEIELLSRKAASTRKPTARQLENAAIQSDIVAYLTAVDMPKSIKELQTEMEQLEGFSNQRISQLLSALVKAGSVVKSYEKKTPFFSVA